ncbi:amidohydrolase family protein [Reichenbachiella sp. MALMAid0571]|uniref:amidohydrolase family protein n=1 Tax=Reichenbachiella sp. MALMAid0571 TaxID=3143939 RepID=UPI0032DF061C
MELKKAIESHLIEGPRMFVSGPIISNIGGQVSGLSEEYHHFATKEYKIINGVEEAIKAVRENIHYGVDLIKICADNSPNNLELSFQEMKTIVDIAHRYNLKVTAHATTNQSAETAIMAGVDCIEHGYDLSLSTLQLMQSKNVALVPTDKSGFLIKKYLMKMGSGGDLDGRVNNMQSRAKNRLALAREAGVTILVGSDNYINFDMPQGEAAKQVLIALKEEGMDPLDILQSATFLSAQWMGMENEIGVFKEGCWADIIAVKNDLQNNFSESMNTVVFVMKEGRIYYKNL